MELEPKISGHVVYYELEDGKWRAMVVFDNFDNKTDAFQYVESVIKAGSILDLSPPCNDETIH
tara:strand:+ start:142 stop:330 length:189 start_codon:yes stop_codon:yes gene_type:complete